MSYVTGKTIKELREKRKLTQKELAEKMDEKHFIKIETIENEYHVTMEHPMDKNHYVSFLASGNSVCRFYS